MIRKRYLSVKDSPKLSAVFSTTGKKTYFHTAGKETGISADRCFQGPRNGLNLRSSVAGETKLSMDQW